MKALKWSGLLTIIIMGCLSSCELIFDYNNYKSINYSISINFQDASGNDLVKGIGLKEESWPVDIPEEQAKSGSVNPDLYTLYYIVPEPCRSYTAPSRFDPPTITMYTYDGLCFLTFGYGHFESQCPAIEVITFKLKCPYVFGNDAFHELVTYWEKAYRNGSVTYFKCNRIEFEGSVITDITIGDGLSGSYTSIATIILKDR